MIIQFYKKDVYGRSLIYIADKDQAEYIQVLTGTKTVTDDQLSALGKLTGCAFVEVFAPGKVY